ncbi:MAG: RNase P modulator RnpM [Thermomicrobiales bacterium]|jgi:predicted RNA-binding protein YlxR (DUF448 family)|nr:YlxR family protein [Thermomicrobiales bacterium]
MSQVHANAPAKTASPAKPGRGKAKGLRPKHVPQRTCIACRETDAKRGLIRLVRTPVGTVEVDPTGKKNGRGAYLCARMSCWLNGINEKTLSRALRLEELTEENRAALLRYADERVPEDEPATSTD